MQARRRFLKVLRRTRMHFDNTDSDKHVSKPVKPVSLKYDQRGMLLLRSTSLLRSTNLVASRIESKHEISEQEVAIKEVRKGYRFNRFHND